MYQTIEGGEPYFISRTVQQVNSEHYTIAICIGILVFITLYGHSGYNCAVPIWL